jgi:hypothetical protein
MIIQLKEITDNSWLVMTEKEQEKIGLLSGNRMGEYTLLSKDGKVNFASEQEVREFFEEDVFSNVVVTPLASATETTIKGYPVDFDNPFVADEEDKISKLPLFTKTKTSKVYHCAGYYCIKFPKGWTQSFSPKLSTLNKYEFAGPFKTEMEMKTNLSILKKTK